MTKQGDIAWNEATHALLCNPSRVALRHNAVQGKLEIRRGGSWDGGQSLGVIQDTNSEEYHIEAKDHLEEGGILPSITYTATPEQPTTGEGGEGEPDTIRRCVLWVTLQE